MNNQQLIKAFPPMPLHPIHRVAPGMVFNRWRTFTAQLPPIGGRQWGAIRTEVLDTLFADWEEYRRDNLPVGPQSDR